VELIPCSGESLAAAILSATAGVSGILLAEPDDLPASLFDRVRQAPGVITDPTEEQLASIEVGVTDAFAGVARTGSVCVPVTKKLGGSVSLFTRWHIAVLNAGSIVSRPRDVFEDPRLKNISLNRDFVFVTGPSATADMGSLVRGVHGPGKLHIIILEC
jgi:L-lactate dehydrogenase complex protein LldG